MTMSVYALTAQQINEMIVNKEPFFLFDVRNESDFADWKIEGEQIEYLNIPYFELIDGVEPVLERLPKDKKNRRRLRKRRVFYDGCGNAR